MKIKSIKLYQHIQLGADLVSFAATKSNGTHKPYELTLMPGVGVLIENAQISTIATFNNIANIDLEKEQPEPKAKKA